MAPTLRNIFLNLLLYIYILVNYIYIYIYFRETCLSLQIWSGPLGGTYTGTPIINCNYWRDFRTSANTHPWSRSMFRRGAGRRRRRRTRLRGQRDLIHSLPAGGRDQMQRQYISMSLSINLCLSLSLSAVS